jgi:hypothetical protein
VNVEEAAEVAAGDRCAVCERLFGPYEGGLPIGTMEERVHYDTECSGED